MEDVKLGFPYRANPENGRLEREKKEGKDKLSKMEFEFLPTNLTNKSAMNVWSDEMYIRGRQPTWRGGGPQVVSDRRGEGDG